MCPVSRYRKEKERKKGVAPPRHCQKNMATPFDAGVLQRVHQDDAIHDEGVFYDELISYPPHFRAPHAVPPAYEVTNRRPNKQKTIALSLTPFTLHWSPLVYYRSTGSTIGRSIGVEITSSSRWGSKPRHNPKKIPKRSPKDPPKIPQRSPKDPKR